MRPAVILTTVLLACTGTEFVEGTTFETGTYAASLIFRVTPPGGEPIDVRGPGGSLSITIRRDGTTTGSLHLPASVTGGAPFTGSMEGTAVITGLTVRFEQEADTFVRDLLWSRIEDTLVVVDQDVNGTRYTITLQLLLND
ncbi:MAG: hypothetical protein ACT4PM_01085 [Gemmatimonadales bacterium]